MSEEEVIKIIEELKEAVRYKTIINNEERGEWKREYNALQGLLNLYEKEKEKNKELEGIKADYIRRMKASNEVLRKQGYINKDKIKEKIEELEKDKNKPMPHELDFKAFYRIEDVINVEIGILKELLGEE